MYGLLCANSISINVFKKHGLEFHKLSITFHFKCIITYEGTT